MSRDALIWVMVFDWVSLGEDEWAPHARQPQGPGLKITQPVTPLRFLPTLTLSLQSQKDEFKINYWYRCLILKTSITFLEA